MKVLEFLVIVGRKVLLARPFSSFDDMSWIWFLSRVFLKLTVSRKLFALLLQFLNAAFELLLCSC